MKRPNGLSWIVVLVLLTCWQASPAFAAPAGPTLTLGALPLSFHQGDPMPPLLFEAAGLARGDSFYTATAAGRPTLTTTATVRSAPGTYPIHLAVGSTVSDKYDLRTADSTMTVLPADGTGARSNSYTYPHDAMVSVKTFGAVGDGTTDDTAALNRALNDGRTDCRADYFRRPKILYLPAGRYRISGQLTFCGGAEVSLRGAGPSQSIIYLAPRTPAFNQPVTLAVLLFPSAATRNAYGNISFRNFVSALSIDIGEGNDNATGLDVVMNNVGAIEDVVITNQESAGPTGISFLHAWNGPMLVRNVAVYGFRNGFTLGHQQYSSVYSHITTEGQTSYGFSEVAGQNAAIEQMYSCNRGPAVDNVAAQIAILNSAFDCGKTTETAYIGHPLSSQHLRNLHVHGYGTTIRDSGENTTSTRSGDIRDYYTGVPKSAHNSVADPSAFELPIEETPIPRDPNPSTWISLATTDPSKWSAQLATCTSSTAYLVAGQYVVPKQAFSVAVPSCIHHIQLFNAGYNPPGAAITFEVRGGVSDPPLIIENAGTNFNFFHNSLRTLAIRHSGGEYTSSANPGTLFLEDFDIGTVTFHKGQHIWARQYDNEYADPSPTPRCPVAVVSTTSCLPLSGVKTVCNGCTLWVLGPKTEKGSTNFRLTDGARMELFGGFFLPLQANQQPNSAVIESTDSSFKADFTQFLYPNGHLNTGTAHIVSDTQKGVTHYIDPVDQNTSFKAAMIYSLGAPAK